jgi:hypothetical protein
MTEADARASPHSVLDAAGATAALRNVEDTHYALALRHEVRLLPSVALHARTALGAACRARFDGRSLREAAEFVCDCSADPGVAPDHYPGLLATQSGTIGAKQALLAALAAEVGRNDVQLIVGCCEMRLPELPPGRVEARLRRPHTLPLAVCWLRFRGRRLQFVDSRHGSLRTLKLVTEVTVRPEQLAAERVRLYQIFAADWCRALEIHPIEFARLRAWQLRASAHTGAFEDLMGHRLEPNFAPAL